MKKDILIYALLVLLGAVSSGLLFWYMSGENNALRTLINQIEAERAKEAQQASQSERALLAEKIALEQTVNDLTATIETLTEDRDQLKEDIEEFEDQVGDALKTVGVLDKLSKIDPELLQKYSKVFFLNEHYRPAKLSEIDTKYLYNENDDEFLATQAMPFFEGMVEDAADDNIDLKVASAFRSFDEQSAVKSAYTVTYGSGANAFSADQGYSEHQLGTTVDFTTKSLNGGLVSAFESTPAFKWLEENAYRYGFTLSYPKGNAYYVYEPWHWRFVGEDLARDLHREDKHFYDLDQREIDEYLISLFD